MAFSGEEWREILEHTRKRVREVGLSELDDRIAVDFGLQSGSGNAFRHYLSVLIGALNERSYSGYERALEALRSSVQTEDGDTISGIEVGITDNDFDLYQTHLVDLNDLTDLSATIRELSKLRSLLLESGAFDE